MTGQREDRAADAAGHDDLPSELCVLGLERGVASILPLPGGYVADAWLVMYADGTRAVGKTVAAAPADMFRAEAEGLDTLRATGHLQRPVPADRFLQRRAVDEGGDHTLVISSGSARVRMGPLRSGDPGRVHSVLYRPMVVSAGAVVQGSCTSWTSRCIR